MTDRICTTCNIEKPISEFYKHADGGWRGRCKPCYGAQCADWSSRNKDKVKLLRSSAYRKLKDKDYHSRRWLKSKYDMSLESYKQMMELQCGKCAICQVIFAEIKDRPQVDHDHDTGVVRGLLCGNCNRGLGQFRDSIELLNWAVTYLVGA